MNDVGDNSVMTLSQFLDWSNDNEMKCNTTTCKELVIRKKGNDIECHGIKQYSHVDILGLTFQSNGKFTINIKAKLGEVNRCLYVIRSLRKEGYNQEHIDLIFKSVILSKLTYGLSVYGACNAELNVVQSFLNSSKLFDIYQLLEQSDKSFFFKARANVCHPLHSLLPKVKDSSLRLRQRASQLPKINTERFKNNFVNRLYFRYKLIVWCS